MESLATSTSIVSLDRAIRVSHTLPAVLRRTRIRLDATLQWLPLWLAAATTAAFVLIQGQPAADQRWQVVVVGAVEGLLGWILTAVATEEWVLPWRANSRSYADLQARTAAAQRRIAMLGETTPAISRLELRALDAAHEEISANLRDTGSADWSEGDGYVNAWRNVHRLEEELLRHAPPEGLRAELLQDELRVEDSKLDRKGSRVRAEIDELRRCLHWDDPTAEHSVPTDGEVAADARARLSRIRAAVNEFRDRRYEGLVRQRNAINRTSGLLGTAGYALMVLAVLVDARPVNVAAVATYYLVGAAAGLFVRLQTDATTTSLEDGYGVQQAQTRQTVVLAGMAAVAGVVLAQFVGGGVKGASELPELLLVKPELLALAAGFGLAPPLLVKQLDAFTSAHLQDLESTQPATSPQK